MQEKSEYAEQKIKEEPYLRWHQPFIFRIIQTYFFVQVILSSVPVGYTVDCRRKCRKEIRFFGTKSNVQIAMYVNDFLGQSFQELWLKYKNETGCSEKSRKSYYRGLEIGLACKLDETRKKVEQERGLMVIRDPKLAERTQDMKSHKSNHVPLRDVMAQISGTQDGMQIKISKGLNGKNPKSAH